MNDPEPVLRSFYKIIHTTCHTQWGGLEKRIFNECVWMEKNGHKPVIAAPDKTPLFMRAKEHGFKVYAVPFRKLTMARDYKFLKRIFKNERPDIVNTHGNQDSKIALEAAAKAKVPLRILSRHISAHVRNSWYNRRIYKKLCHYVFTTADCTTDHIKKVFKLRDTQVFSIPSGITPPEYLIKKDEAKKQLAQELGLGPEARFIGFAGRVSKDKGISYLIEAFKKISSRLPEHHLVIVGYGIDAYIKFLETLSSNLNISSKVHFTGLKQDIWPVYRAFDCKVLPSVNINNVPFEGVPQALLEAMYCKCPVIGSGTGGIPDIIRHGQTGFLTEVKNSSDIADKILETLVDNISAEKRAENARRLVEKYHTIDAMGRNITRIYRLHQVKLDRDFSI